jgi:hypothetical protein
MRITLAMAAAVLIIFPATAIAASTAGAQRAVEVALAKEHATAYYRGRVRISCHRSRADHYACHYTRYPRRARHPGKYAQPAIVYVAFKRGRYCFSGPIYIVNPESAS